MKSYTSVFAPMTIAVLAVFAFLSIGPLTAMAGNSPSVPENTIRMSRDGDTLSARITDADISEVAQMLSEATGAKVLLDQSIEHTVTSRFENESVETGIKKLLGPDLNTALTFVKVEKSPDKPAFHLDTLRIFNRGDKSSADFKEFRQTVSETSTADEKSARSRQHLGQDSRHPRQRPDFPMSEQRKAMLAEAHKDITRRKKEMRRADVSKDIVRLRMQLSQNLPPEERMKLVRQLSQARRDIRRMRQPGTKTEMATQSFQKHPSGINPGMRSRD